VDRDFAVLAVASSAIAVISALCEVVADRNLDPSTL